MDETYHCGMVDFMDAQTFIDTYGWAEAARVAELAQTSRGYFAHIAKHRRNASVDLAMKLVDASEGRLDFMSLIKSTPDRKAA